MRSDGVRANAQHPLHETRRASDSAHLHASRLNGRTALPYHRGPGRPWAWGAGLAGLLSELMCCRTTTFIIPPLRSAARAGRGGTSPCSYPSSTMNGAGGGGRARPCDVCEIACGPEYLLGPVHLTRKRVLHPGHKMGFVGQICDDGGHMPRPFQVKECTTNTALSISLKMLKFLVTSHIDVELSQ